ncbi:MAG: hypothetical protein LBR36_05425 [Bacteroidales bacterium]|nr:hypothetical protein [Bacteroidales bacterium]
MTIKKRPLRQYRLILSCLVLSFIAWFVMKISKDYTQVYEFELVFFDSTEEQNVVDKSDSLLVVEYSAKGIALLPIELLPSTIEVDCRKLYPLKKHLPDHLKISNKDLKQFLVQNYDFPEKVRLLSPKSVNLRIE